MPEKWGKFPNFIWRTALSCNGGACISVAAMTPMRNTIPWWAYVALIASTATVKLLRITLIYRLAGKALEKAGKEQIAEIISAVTGKWRRWKQ